MASVDLHAARIPDRDRMVSLLREHGLEPEPHGELEIRIPCEDEDTAACDDLFAYVESVVLDLGATMIPIQHDGVIYLRPPVG
jgi:hypothetical protein